MGLFCGERCECKNRCDADLQWNDTARKACREACKSDPTILSGYAWLNSQPTEIQMLYNYEPNLITGGGTSQGGAPVTGAANAQGGSTGGISIGLIAILAALAIAAFVVLKKLRG